MKIESNVPPWIRASIFTGLVILVVLVISVISLILDHFIGRDLSFSIITASLFSGVWVASYLSAKKGSYEKG